MMTKKQISEMCDMFATRRYTDKAIAKKIGATLKQVQYQKWKLNYTEVCKAKITKWNDEKIKYIKQLWHTHHDAAKVAEILGMKESSLRTKMSQLRREGKDAPYMYKPRVKC